MRTAKLGATLRAGSYDFLVWAPTPEKVALHLVDSGDLIPMSRDEWGYWSVTVERLPPGSRYFYRLNDSVDRGDPASRYQPEGPYGPSEVVSSMRAPMWNSPRLCEFIIYELHVGTFTPEGTLDSAIDDLERLQNLGVTAVELMPLAEFPGTRNWGYDGVFPFAVEESYGGPAALHRFIEACHARNIAVVIDVVYNHLGPEGNYLREFGPYFTAKYRTPWGDAINLDGPQSDHVRRLFIENALYWIDEMGADALRLDAVHAMYDRSAYPFVQQLADTVHDVARETRRNAWLIAESDLNDARLVLPAERGGYGIDAQWSDDFHHSLHTLLTGESMAYYRDFGRLEHFAASYQHGWAYSGQYSEYRQVRFGNSPAQVRADQFIVCSQNHDQVGNRMLGRRLIELAGWRAARLAAAATLLSPFVPLLFMGEEYGEMARFPYFVSHTDPDLLRAVREGRLAEFAGFINAKALPPDPAAEGTFERSKLNRRLLDAEPHGGMYRYYRRLIELRRSCPELRRLDKSLVRVDISHDARSLIVLRENRLALLLHMSRGSHQMRIDLPPGRWDLLLHSNDPLWGGEGASLPHFIQSGESIVLDNFVAAAYRLRG